MRPQYQTVIVNIFGRARFLAGATHPLDFPPPSATL